MIYLIGLCGILCLAGFTIATAKSWAAVDSVASSDVKDLPLVELYPKAMTSETFVVLLSGDGGWASIDQALGKAFIADGYPVVGLNSLKYFWTPRTPESFTADLSRLLKHYQTTWKKNRVIVVGYSQGADVLPFALRRLPPELLATIRLAVFVGAGQRAHFEFHVTHWFGSGNIASTKAILPELDAIESVPMLCLNGDDEESSLCDIVDRHRIPVIELDGGHHFEGHYDRIARHILEFASR